MGCTLWFFFVIAGVICIWLLVRWMINVVECPAGTFGAECALTCHCPDGDTCSNVNGICSSDRCAYGWGGASCQRCESACRLATYDVFYVVVAYRKWNFVYKMKWWMANNGIYTCHQTTDVIYLFGFENNSKRYSEMCKWILQWNFYTLCLCHH